MAFVPKNEKFELDSKYDFHYIERLKYLRL
jgi:hypothetical protein